MTLGCRGTEAALPQRPFRPGRPRNREEAGLPRRLTLRNIAPASVLPVYGSLAISTRPLLVGDIHC
jgi:hypothetical protein